MRQNNFPLTWRLSLLATLLAGLLAAMPTCAAPLLFGVLSHETDLPDQLTRRASENLAFIVVNGIRSETEPCNETLYQQRRDWLEASEHSVIVSLAASDWLSCGHTNPLHEVRERLFDGDFTLGASKLPLVRLSSNRKFRRYVENARWELNGILFATVNLPAGNNYYRFDAGRNGEFEDRTVANRLWLQRLFALAQQKKMRAIVLFSDGNLWQPYSKVKRDGFLEVRTQITQLSGKMHGKLLLVDNQSVTPSATQAASGIASQTTTASAKIAWRGNVGHVSLNPGWHAFRTSPNPQQPIALLEQR